METLRHEIANEDGYELWLRYPLVDDAALRASYQNALQQIIFDATSPTLEVAKTELLRGLAGLLGEPVVISQQGGYEGTLLVGTPQQVALIDTLLIGDLLAQAGDEGYVIVHHKMQGKQFILITANTDIGILYGVFHFLRLLQTQQPLDTLKIVSAPKTKLRMLNHWDHLDGMVIRGYAGFSLWDWHKLPDYIDPRYQDYARAAASIGLNGTQVVGSSGHALILTEPYLYKLAALADVFRPYGIRVYLPVAWNAPMQMAGIDTADPRDRDVIAWWQHRIDLIYSIIPDFGGFVVKANSEGEPGPHDYGRNHAEGGNMLARAVAPYGGNILWRAFVYDPDDDEDRTKQANTQFVPLDGEFANNALLQVKNGPLDFQPREPFHPLFGAMPATPLVLEVQLTQEYLGCATHLAYLAPLYKETLDADTYAKGPGSTVAKVVDGSLDGHEMSGMAAVTNIGNDRNWCGHPFAAANWYAFGRLAWDHTLTSEAIADEWLRMTFTNNATFVQQASKIMMASREAVVDYMMPLGLHHIFALDHHYGPGPWVDDAGRDDWTSVYYHQADSEGVGFDRTPGGSNAVNQYHAPLCEQYANIETCPEALLLWFHHVPWTYTMQSGRTLWDELCYRYNEGVYAVRDMQATWDSLAPYIDSARFEHVKTLLVIQEKEARWWRDACLLYFQSFSGMPIPDEYEQPENTLEYYRNLKHYYVPGIPERRF